MGSSPIGEANKQYQILTKDLGLIRASAQGVRLLKSKLRYSLQEFSIGEVSLVRGKEFWRVVGAKKQKNIYEELRASPEKVQVFARVFSLLKRLLRGEDKNELLFLYISQAFYFIEKETVPSILVRNFEYVLVLRILSTLGYLGTSPDTAWCVESPYLDIPLLTRVSEVKPVIVQEINKSLKETQL